MAEAEEGEITENEISEEEDVKQESIADEEIQAAEENEMLLEELGEEETEEQVMEEEVENEEAGMDETEMKEEGMEEDRMEEVGMEQEGMEEEEMEGDEVEENKMEQKEIEEKEMEEKQMEEKEKKEEEMEETEMKQEESADVKNKEAERDKLEELEMPLESLALKGKIDDETMKKIEQVEKVLIEAANSMYILKGRADELLRKEKMTETEEKELEEVNLELIVQLDLFDEKTQEIQDIIANTNILETMPVRLPQAKHEEDVLPRVVLCGEVEDYVPKIVVCNNKTKGLRRVTRECMPGCPGSSTPPVTPCPEKVCDIDDVKKKKGNENADLEKIRSRLEEDISNKDKILDDLKLNLITLQNEIRMVSTENTMLSERIRKLQQGQAKQKKHLSEQKKTCPSLTAAKLQEYSEYTRKLEKQLAEMETDFNTVHREICAAQKDRDRLQQTKNTMAKPFCKKK